MSLLPFFSILQGSVSNNSLQLRAQTAALQAVHTLLRIAMSHRGTGVRAARHRLLKDVLVSFLRIVHVSNDSEDNERCPNKPLTMFLIECMLCTISLPIDQELFACTMRLQLIGGAVGQCCIVAVSPRVDGTL
jgi:hypothetical protein